MKFDYSLVDFPEEGNNYGHYTGNYPYQAAKKVFGKLSKKIGMNNSNKKFLVFSIINNQTGKIYTYQGYRIKLHTPRTVTLKNGSSFQKHYKVIVTKHDKNFL